MHIRSVHDIVANRPAPVIAPGASLREAAHRLDAHDVGALVVIDGGRVTGLLSERDIIRKCIGRDLSPDSTTVAEAMTPAPVTIRAGDGLAAAIRHMEAGHFRHLPVLDDGGACIGLLSIRDIPAEYRMMVERFAEMRGQRL
jgi:CBS domain-containing protein